MKEVINDVVVVGAGIIGSSIAWRLAQQRMRVAVIEAGVLGGEASSAGAGMLAPGGEIEERTAWAEMALESLAMYPAYVQELQEQSGIPIDYRRPGGIDLAFTDEEWTALEQRSRRQTEIGIISQLLTRAEIARMCPEVTADRGLLYPNDALVDPVQVMCALRRVLEQLGVELLEHRRVQGILPKKNSVTVDTEHGPVVGRHAVLAAGAWSGGITVQGYQQAASFPVKGHLTGYDLPAGSLGPILRREHTYILQRSNGFTVAGSTAERVGFDHEIDLEKVEDIRRRAEALYPRLAGVTPSRTWVGLRPATSALVPEIGRLPDSNLWLAYGHYRNGILLAPGTARKLASSISTG